MMALKFHGIFFASALAVFLTSGCAGSATWAKNASSDDIEAATDFDLCHGYRNYNVNPTIKTEILRRKLLTEDEWDQLVKTGHPPALSVGGNKCLSFTEGYWNKKSQEDVDGRAIEKWEYPGCEPTLFTLMGRLCPYRLEVTFEDDFVEAIACYGNDCEHVGFKDESKN